LTTETRSEMAPRRVRRRFWTVGPVVLTALAIVVTLKATSLNGLPDVGDPFDVEEFSRPIPDETNAFVVYKRAFDKLGKDPINPAGVWKADWASSSDDQRRWLEQSREALELWKQGTSRPDALYISPKTLNVSTLLPVIQGMRSFARLAVLEGTRLEAEGDLNGALDWYLAVLRSSRHCGKRGVAIERLVGIAIGAMVSTRLSTWAVDPKVDATMLRKALDAVIQADSMTPKDSDSFKCEYISFVNTIADPAYEDPAKLTGLAGGKPTWSWSTSGLGQACSRAERSLKKEPERSRRVYRLIMANWLAYCDRPTSKRPPFATFASPTGSQPIVPTMGFQLFDPEPDAPGSLKALAPDQLAQWFHSTVYAEIFSPNFGGINKALNRDRATFAHLLILLANETYKKEKGEYPKKVEELVGPYLKALPEGYVPIDDGLAEKPPTQ
jgi:hypothetical protein